jgi:hypothetical protein
MKLLCVDGIPARGLYSGSIYTELARWTCCGRMRPQAFVSIAESIGHIDEMWCRACGVVVPDAPMGWYDAKRFVPWDPPKLSIEDVDELYDMPLELVDDAGWSGR